MSEEIPLSEVKEKVGKLWNEILDEYEFFVSMESSIREKDDRFQFFGYFVYEPKERKSLGVVLEIMKSTLNREYEDLIDDYLSLSKMRIQDTIKKHLSELL